jgi:uncharacterized protein (TIRG00374 family)
MFTLLLAAILLIVVLNGIDWNQTFSIVRSGRIEFILTGALTLFVSYTLRSLRWHVLLKNEKPLPIATTFWGTWVGYLGNSFLPARAGEIIRTVLVSRKTGISVSYVLATALTERLVDAVVLVIIVLTTISTLGTIPDWLLSGVRTMSVLAVAGVVALFITPLFEQRIRTLFARLPVSPSLHQKIDRLTERFLVGMRVLRNRQNAFMFLALTLVTWSVDVAVALQIARAFDLHFTVIQTLLLLAALGLSSAAPSTPGYIGIYQFVTVAVLTPFGYTQNEALVFIVTFQIVSYLLVANFGGIGLLKLNTGKWRMLELTKLRDEPA